MPDRLNGTQRRPAVATPTRHRPQVHQPPLAALQAKAGNRAVASVIQRAASATQLPGTTGQQQATPAAVDDLAITPVTEPEQRGREQRGRGERRGDGAKAKQPAEDAKARQQAAKDAKARQQAAEDEAKKQKEAAADAAGKQVGATEKAWKASGEAIGARRKAAAARDDLEAFSQEVVKAERDQGASLNDERRHLEAAGRATWEQEQAQDRARTQKDAETTAREKATAAEKAVKKYTEQAEKAEAEQAAAKKDVERFATRAEKAEAMQAAAQKAAEGFKAKAQEAEQKLTAAQEAARQAAEVEDKAQQQAAKAEAEAAERAETERKVQKWAQDAADALKQAEKAEGEARKHGEDADAAKNARDEAGLQAQKWKSTAKEARDGAKKAEDERKLRSGEADTAATARADAERDAARHAGDAVQAAEDAGGARARAGKFEETAKAARRMAQAASDTIRNQSEAAGRARDRAAAAARARAEAGTTEAGAKTAWMGAKTAAAEARKTAEASERAEASASGAQESGRSTRERLKKPFSATRAKQRGDVPDTMILRGSAPVGGPVRAEASKDGNDELLRATAQQGQVETGVNLVNSALGAFNDARDVKAGFEGRNGTGIESRQDRKKLRSKSAGLTQNVLMGVNDGTKIVDNAVRNAENLAGVAPLGATGGILTMAFSVLIAIRDGLVIKDTYDKRKKLREHYEGVAAARTRRLQDVLDDLGKATDDLVRECSGLSGPESGWDEGALQAVQDERNRIEGLRGELLGHLAGVRDYAVDKQERRLRKRAADLTGNTARTAAGAVAIAAAVGAVSGPIAPAVVGGTAAAALGGIAVHKGRKKAHKRYVSVRHPDKHARPTAAQEGTEETGSTQPRMSKDGKGGRKRDATAEAFKVTKSIKQGKRQFNAQELYAAAAGPAVPVGKNVPDDIRRTAREFLKDLKCDPAKYGWTQEQWEASLDDPEQQAEWEGEIAKQLASA